MGVAPAAPDVPERGTQPARARRPSLLPEALVYRCILVPLDGTPFGEAALPLAVSIARRAGAALQLVHVHLPPIIPSGAETAALPPVWIETSWQEKRDYLEALASGIQDRWRIHVEARVMEGGVAAALERHATRCAAGLIVMSTHGHAGISRLWHHGVADQLTRDLHLPVVLLRAPEEGAPQQAAVPVIENILVLLDGSTGAERVIEHALAFARQLGGRLTLAHVFGEVSRSSALSLARGPLDGANAVARAETAARQYLNGLAERLRGRGARVETRLLPGQHAAATILEYVEASASDPLNRVDLVALEAPDRGRVSRLLLRGTADELISGASVPVLLHQAVPQPAPERAVFSPGLVGSG